MDIETRFEIIRTVGEEIITEQELFELLETKDHPIAYDGFEPSGMAHIPFGVYRAININNLLKAGIKFKLLLADWYAWVNNKLSGDIEKIKKVGEYFIEVWKATGIDMNKVEVHWASDIMNSKEYWKKVISIAKNTTVNRAIRCLTIMGRTKTELKTISQLFYPMMQCADIFHLEADICQLGVDQRRANILAREIGSKLNWWKPVIVSHHMLMGLDGIKRPEGYDESEDIDLQISSKMSKSKPKTCLYVHDSEQIIKQKINNAFCPEGQDKNNPILEYCKYIIFNKLKSFKIERESQFGGNIEVENYDELSNLFLNRQIHPLDLKKATAKALNEIIKPIREHFEKNKRANELYTFVKKVQITR